MAEDTFKSFEKFSNDWLYKQRAYNKPKYAFYSRDDVINFVEVFGSYGKKEYYVKDHGTKIDFNTGEVGETQYVPGYPIGLIYYDIFDTVEEMHQSLVDNIFDLGFL